MSYVGNGPDGEPSYEPVATAFERALELDRLRAENAELKRRAEAIQEQMAEGRVVNTRLTEERDRLRAENAELRKANANVQHVAAEYEERIKALQEQVSQVRRDFERKWVDR